LERRRKLVFVQPVKVVVVVARIDCEIPRLPAGTAADGLNPWCSLPQHFELSEKDIGPCLVAEGDAFVVAPRQALAAARSDGVEQ
jgi:hypothetical protein